jgi:hypothetical protein
VSLIVSVAYDLIPESYLGCLGLVECPDLRPLQPAPPRLAPSASVASFSPSVSPGHSPGPDSINRWDIPSPNVRHLGVEPQSYRQQRLSGTVIGSLFIECLQYEPAYFFLL